MLEVCVGTGGCGDDVVWALCLPWWRYCISTKDKHKAPIDRRDYRSPRQDFPCPYARGIFDAQTWDTKRDEES